MSKTMPQQRTSASPERAGRVAGRGDGWFAATLLVLAAALVLNTVLGPLGVDVLAYPVTETVENQLVGLELVTVVIVAPWCVAAAVLAARGHAAAAALDGVVGWFAPVQ